MEKGKVHAYFKNQKELPTEYPKGAIWDGREDMIAFHIPIAVLFLFGVAQPTGNLTDPDYHHAMRRLGGVYEFHAIAMMHVNANYKDVEEVMTNIETKELTTTYIQKEGCTE
jgi:hypothetical protein